MEYEAWAPIYEAIVTAFGFDPADVYWFDDRGATISEVSTDGSS